MSTRGRHITAAVLLASYLLASVGAGLHAVRECQRAADAGPPAMAQRGAHGGCEHRACQGEWGLASSARHAEGAKQASEPGPVPSHHHDDCTVCRFQLTKKLVEFVSHAAILAGDCPESIVPDVPPCRAASLLATPECRAPPVLA